MKYLKHPTKFIFKEISTIKISDQVYNENYSIRFKNETKDVLMLLAWKARGTVFAVGDPWLYNEYVDGRKLPAEFENFKAANDLVKWALSKVTQRSKS